MPLALPHQRFHSEVSCMGFWEYMQGKKTYCLAILGAIIAASQWLQGNTTYAEAFGLIAAIAATIRDAISNVKKTVVVS